MRRVLIAGVLLAAIVAFSAAKFAARNTPSYCMQITGGSFSGDLGFFRFKGTRPTTAGAIVNLAGRVAGLDPVFGTAEVTKDGATAEYGATFFADADEGQIDVSFSPPSAKNGSGYADYGQYGVSTSVTAKIVNCSNEP